MRRFQSLGAEQRGCTSGPANQQGRGRPGLFLALRPGPNAAFWDREPEAKPLSPAPKHRPGEGGGWREKGRGSVIHQAQLQAGNSLRGRNLYSERPNQSTTREVITARSHVIE